jgi:deazaflavin-dependent oxidoreductase (nitroreductase family)
MFISDDNLRAMYAGGHGNATARRFSRCWARVFDLGILPRRWVTLEVTGRRSGQTRRFPLGMADWEGRWYLVPMLGERCHWVQNVRAAGGRAVIRRRRGVRCRLVELPEAERPAILRRYLRKVPGARPHIPLAPDAPAADFAAIAPRYPVFRVVPEATRRRRWPRRLLLGMTALLALIVLATWAFIKLQPTLPPLALPATAAQAPAGPLAGTWTVSSGTAGFRVAETALGMSNDTVGRTGDVSGSLVVSGHRVTSATFRIDLAAVKVNGKTQPQFVTSLHAGRFPVATFTLASPATFGSALASGGNVGVTAAGRLSLNGVTRPVTVTVSGRRDGAGLEVAGSIPVAFSRWDIKGPGGLGFLGSLADRGVAEFLLTLHQR